MNTINHTWALIKYSLLGAILIAGIACSSGDSTQLSKLSPNGIILAFGDSLTYGTGAGGSQYSYPSILAEKIERQVINEGVPGELSGEGVARLPQVLDRYQPHLVILCHGGNDLLRQRADSQIVANLQKMIELVRERGIEIVLLAVPRPTLLFMESASFYTEIAREYHIPVDNKTLVSLEKNSALKSDRVHLNREGYRLLGEAVFRLLRGSGAL
ncbi:GDSL-type esterase/lipase family protein [Nitrosococcus watsonii]|uniref:Lipolytic protein G-D-S-L family n=1 Tax=Nitrosococcus watsoni (strain C-113) TaxID=105559 RepID=D8K736_NITWC|nr:GDSL-type esterase/lipase family protein [Nitrosococcus watsonii]ADJ28713.1 lipolytic protein G-D-S-L family [Nitrosococcus watsonii C-113]